MNKRHERPSRPVEGLTEAPRLPPGFDPPRLLRAIVRDLEGTLRPALDSQALKDMASNMSALLRSLAVRLDDSASGAAASVPSGELLSAEGELTPAAARAIRSEVELIDATLTAESNLDVLEGDLPYRTQLELTPARLTTYLRARGFAGVSVVNVQKVNGGFSKESFLVDIEQQDGRPLPVVIRRDIRHGTVKRSVVQEYPLLAKLHELCLPVPEPMLLEADRAAFAEPFMIMRRAPGANVSNVRGLEVSKEHVTAAFGLAEVLGKLHATDPKSLALDLDGASDANLEQQLLREIGEAEATWFDHRREASPTVAAGFAWLRAHVPTEPAFGRRLVHGDAGLHNLLMSNGAVSAMLDWELARLGHPAEDLAYCRGWIDGVMPWRAFLEAYHSHGGPAYDDGHERFYRIFTDLRIVGYVMRGLDNVDFGDRPELPLAFGVQHYERHVRRELARRLLEAVG